MSSQIKITGQRKKIPRGDPLRDKIIVARLNLTEEFPFFGYISMFLEPLETDEVPTIGVTADKKLLVNRTFCDAQTEKDMMVLLAHEAMHLVTETGNRFPAKVNPIIWNIASDIAINYLLFNPEHGAGLPLPACQPLYQTMPTIQGNIDLTKYWGKSTEAIYYDLIQNQIEIECNECSGNNGSQGNNNGGSKQGCKHWFDDSGSRCVAASEQEKEVWKRIVQQSAEMAKQAGKLPGMLEELIIELSQPKKDWRRELQYYVATLCRRRFDWKKRNRRTIALAIITPGQSPYLPMGITGIDTSGSMSDPNIRTCVNEHAGILSAAGGIGKLGLFDAELYYYGDVDLQAITKLPVQRGGTDFRPFFEKIKEEEYTPAYVVVFTDLCGPFPEDAPEYPVIFCVPKGNNLKAPWKNARIIEVEIEE